LFVDVACARRFFPLASPLFSHCLPELKSLTADAGLAEFNKLLAARSYVDGGENGLTEVARGGSQQRAAAAAQDWGASSPYASTRIAALLISLFLPHCFYFLCFLGEDCPFLSFVCFCRPLRCVFRMRPTRLRPDETGRAALLQSHATALPSPSLFLLLLLPLSPPTVAIQSIAR